MGLINADRCVARKEYRNGYGATWMAPGVLQVRDYLDVTG
jgi:hypothetical protein